MTEKFFGKRRRTLALAAGTAALCGALSAGYPGRAVSLAQETDIVIENQEQVAEQDILPAETESAIDFRYYQNINSDVYAWIYYPGTGGIIDYPLMQSVGDQEFYLHHDWQGYESYPGSVFSQFYNRKSFTDFLTILYGHNMRDRSMFGSLREMEGSDIMWNYDTIYIYLPQVTLNYHIFAAYVNDNRHLLYNFDQDDAACCQNYIKTIGEKCEGLSTFDRDVYETLTEDSHILTLSTCYRGDPEHRFLVQAVLDESGEAGKWIALQQAKEDAEEQAARERALKKAVSAAKKRRAALVKERDESGLFGEESDQETESETETETGSKAAAGYNRDTITAPGEEQETDAATDGSSTMPGEIYGQGE